MSTRQSFSKCRNSCFCSSHLSQNVRVHYLEKAILLKIALEFKSSPFSYEEEIWTLIKDIL